MEKNADYPYQHIHAVGSYGWPWMPDLVRAKGVDLTEKKGITMNSSIKFHVLRLTEKNIIRDTRIFRNVMLKKKMTS